MSRLFPSFFLGGFECSTHLTTEGHRLDVVAATQHDVQAREDYALCGDVGIRAVREAARWPIFDRGGNLDLDPIRRLARLGREAGLVQVWDLMHYGYPDDVDLFAPEFVERFASFARAVAVAVRTETDGPSFYTPVNEISYNAWAAGEVGYMAPFARGRGSEVKRALVHAAIAGADAIWEVDPGAQMLSVEPLVVLHAPPGRPDLRAEADDFNETWSRRPSTSSRGASSPSSAAREHIWGSWVSTTTPATSGRSPRRRRRSARSIGTIPTGSP